MRRELRDLLPRGSLALRPKRSGSVVGLVGQVSGGERGVEFVFGEESADHVQDEGE